tara:strand:- start:3943 stop:6300 length:2358 start_codon:yes stop_codon:yes gene_type:complete
MNPSLRAICFVFLAFASASLFGETVEYDLVIRQQNLDFTGKARPAMTINGGIPGPTLQFTNGDRAVINVTNEMDAPTSIHWHGLLLPNDQDGVPFVTYPPIAPGTTFRYEFTLRQTGTYWYHSHSGLQEQSGVYGSIVILPRGGEKHHADHDEVVLLSDWTDENPHEVLRTLKRGSEYYAIKKGSAQSLTEAARLGRLGDYFKRELQRMPPMDISDVAYDHFLANGEPETQLKAAPGETVRLRVIDGSATTFFFLEYAGGPMTIISADGQEVEPVREERFLIGVAETYDVLVKVPAHGSYEFRATAHDGSGQASVWIGHGERHPAPDIPKPDLYATMGSLKLQKLLALTPAGAMGMNDAAVESGKFDKPGMMGMSGMGSTMEGMPHGGGGDQAMSGMKMSQGMNHGEGNDQGMPGMKMDHGKDSSEAPAPMNHGEMKMPMNGQAGPSMNGMEHGSARSELAVDGMDPRRPWPIYSRLRAVRSTALPKDKPVREIRLTLDGDMERYVWFINNKALHETDQIHIREGEVVRFIMINRTMMHHPMHLHGHFFRVVNGQGDRAPLKHTVDVEPMSTTVIEFYSDEVGDWFFHCHLLYHMHSGMARVVEYDNFQPAPETAAVRHELFEDPWYFWAEGAGMSHMTEGNLTLSNTRTILNANWEIGWGNVDETEYEIPLTAAYSFNRFLSVFGGAELTNNDLGDRGIFGLSYPLPLLIDSYAWVDTDGEFRFGAAKGYPITPRLGIFGEVQYDTRSEWEWAAGLEWILGKRASLIGQYHSEFGLGGGLGLRF